MSCTSVMHISFLGVAVLTQTAAASATFLVAVDGRAGLSGAHRHYFFLPETRESAFKSRGRIPTAARNRKKHAIKTFTSPNSKGLARLERAPPPRA